MSVLGFENEISKWHLLTGECTEIEILQQPNLGETWERLGRNLGDLGENLGDREKQWQNSGKTVGLT